MCGQKAWSPEEQVSLLDRKKGRKGRKPYSSIILLFVIREDLLVMLGVLGWIQLLAFPEQVLRVHQSEPRVMCHCAECVPKGSTSGARYHNEMEIQKPDSLLLAPVLGMGNSLEGSLFPSDFLSCWDPLSSLPWLLIFSGVIFFNDPPPY